MNYLFITYPFLIVLGGSAKLLYLSFKEFFKGKVEKNLLTEQVYQIGIKSLPVVLVTTGFIGMVMALQFGIGLAKFGGKLYIPKIISLSIVRELGPVFASIMISARVGSGMTSEIGSMRVTEQIDAIRALGASPIVKIVLPRVLGCFIALPLLTAFANTVGILGGLLVGSNDLGLDPNYYLQKVLSTINVADYLSGFMKCFFFSFLVSVPACYFGLNVKGGTKGVGVATTKTVVTSCIAILICDYFLTKLFWVIETWL